MQFFCAPVLGNLSDHFGRRPVLLFALLALGCDYLIMGFAPVIGWLFVGRADRGRRRRLVHPRLCVRRRHHAARSGAHRPSASWARPSASVSSWVLPSAGCSAALGPRAPFFAAGALALANATLGYFALPESLPRASRRAIPLGARQPARHARADAPLSGRAADARRAVPVAARAPGVPQHLGVLHASPSSTGRAPRSATRSPGSGLVMADRAGPADAGADPAGSAASGARRSPAWLPRWSPTSAMRSRPQGWMMYAVSRSPPSSSRSRIPR